ncbi:MAG: anti-sigma factor [Anaerolineae bacterium]|nr:anti-sigma factor [Anaerolineae bacterium]
MNSELSREQILDMLPAFALGALEPEEMLLVEDYLEQNSDLLPELHLAEEAVAQLAHAAPMTPLPADAKARLMSRVEADRRPAPAPPVAAAETVGAGWLDTVRAWFTPLNGWTVVAGAAAAILVIVLLSTGQLQSRLDRLTDEVADLQTMVSELQTANSQLQQTNQVLEQRLQTDQARLTFIANTSPQQTFQVPATANSPTANANGTLYVGNDNDALLLLQGLEPLAADQTYELWVARAGDTIPTSAGLIDLQPDNNDWFLVSLPLTSQDVNVVGLSIEPAGGSPGPGPSGPIVLHTR